MISHETQTLKNLEWHKFKIYWQNKSAGVTLWEKS